MIHSFEELGEVLAEFENRISFLENSQHFHEPKEEHSISEICTPESEWSKNQRDTMNQLKAEVVHWRKQHSEVLLEIDKLRPPIKKPRQHKYTNREK